MGELYGKNFIEKIMPIRTEETPKNTTGFRSAIVAEEYADEITVLLHKLMKGKSAPKDIMRPIRAAIDAGVLRPITYMEFKEEFGDVMKNNYSLLYKYINEDYTKYENEKIFNDMKRKFENIGLAKT